jgi:hypothetical protein
MVPLGKVTDRMSAENKSPEFRFVLLQTLPTRLFGKILATNIKEVRISGNRMVLQVPDPRWRNELEENKEALLEKVQKVHNYLTTIELVP